MARPQFGTTRGHMAWLLASSGETAFRTWLTGIHANGVKLYDGNSAVVRAVSQGEIDVGLTDSDDVVAGQREKWPVGYTLGAFKSIEGVTLPGSPLPIPNTAGLLKGGPHPKEAAALLDFLLSERLELMLARSESANRPIRDTLAQQFRDNLPIPTMPIPDYSLIHTAESTAMKACTDILGE